MSAIPQHSSESVEHYTPLDVIEAARSTLGKFDLDPASSFEANKFVRAEHIYTQADGGHRRRWFGRVFLNPPGGLVDHEMRPVITRTKTRKPCSETLACGLREVGHKHEGVTSSAKAWWFRLARDWVDGHVEAAVFVGFTLEILQSTQDKGDEYRGLPVPLDFPFCVPQKRLRFRSVGQSGEIVDGDQPTHGNVIVLLPPKRDPEAMTRAFGKHFIDIGRIAKVRV